MVSRNSRNHQIKQSGQTLIETIGAIFILTMGLSAGLGLAIYAFSNSALSQNEIIAANLAREGIEVLRLMRDSNWLASDVKGVTDPNYQLQPCPDINDKLCFPKTYSRIVDYNEYNFITHAAGLGISKLSFNSNTGVWAFDDAAPDPRLYLQADGRYAHTNNGTPANFGRMVSISFNNGGNYANNNNYSNEELVVKSVVAWKGKRCANFGLGTNLFNLNTKCKVIVEEHLTNWKDYK